MRFNDGLLSEFGVLVNVDLSVNTVDIEVGSNSPRINFDLGSVNINKHLVDLVELLNSLGVGLTLKT